MERQGLAVSRNCSGTHSIAQVVLKPSVLFLPLPPEFWDYQGCATMSGLQNAKD